MKTFVKRYFETEESLNLSLTAFKDSGFFSNHEIKKVGEFTILEGVSNLSLYDMKTKFPDALTIKE